MRLVAVSLICTTGQNLQVMLKSGKDSRSQRSAHKKEINNHFGLQAYRCLLVFMTVYYLVFIGNFQVDLLAEVLHTGPGLPWCPAVPGSLQGHVPVDLNNRSWSDLHRSLAQAVNFIHLMRNQPTLYWDRRSENYSGSDGMKWHLPQYEIQAGGHHSPSSCQQTEKGTALLYHLLANTNFLLSSSFL